MTTHEVVASPLALSPRVPLPAFGPIPTATSHGEKASIPASTATDQQAHAQEMEGSHFPTIHALSPSLQQIEVMERLKELMAWQERQKANLFRQQQEEIRRLQKQRQIPGQQEQDGICHITEDDSGVTVGNAGPQWDEGNISKENHFQPAVEYQSDSDPKVIKETGVTTHGTLKDTESPVKSHSNKRISNDNVGSGLGHYPYDERPIKPGIGKSVPSFEELVESSLEFKSPLQEPSDHYSAKKNIHKKPFLKQGQGIARFGLKSGRVQFKNKPQTKKLSPQAQHLDREKVKGAQKEGADCKVVVPKHMVRKVATRASRRERSDSGSPCLDIPEVDPRMSTPSLVRCSSEESFIIRRDHRLEVERDELLEFEMLEKVADSSFSSQLSLFNKSTPCQLDSNLDSNVDSRHVHVSDKDQHADDDQSEGSSFNPTECPKQTSPVNPSDASDDDIDNEEADLDETLKFSPSLAKGVEFNDEEAWESFTHDSPHSRSRTESSGSDTTLPEPSHPSVGAFSKSPVKREVLDENQPFLWTPSTQDKMRYEFDSRGFAVIADVVGNEGKQVGVERSRVVQSLPCTSGISYGYAPSNCSPMQSTESRTLRYSNNAPSHQDSSVEIPPPPSALVSKLFPALCRVEKEPKKTSDLQTKLENQSPPSTKIPSPVSSAGEDSGITRSNSSTSMNLSEDLKFKLSQLEEEIERYRSENAALEELKREREEGLVHLRQEIAEFTKQRDEEISRFEDYKKEEIKKLKKERKVFEAYQLEANAARDRKDKEEIRTLRTELLALQEDLKSREARWGATLSRYRLKIESLEAENQELQADLRVMEQERLHTWQMQVEQEVLAKKKSISKEAESKSNIRTELNKKTAKSVLKENKSPTRNTVQPKKIVRTNLAKKTANRTSTKESPLHQNVNQILHPKFPKQARVISHDDSDTGLSSCGDDERGEDTDGVVEIVGVQYEQDSDSIRYQGDSEDSISVLADEIVMQVMGDDAMTKRLGEKELKENIGPRTPVHTGGVKNVSRNLKVSSTRSVPLTEISNEQSASKESRRSRLPKSVRFSVSPPPATANTEKASRQRLPSTIQQNELSEVIQQDGSKVITFNNGTRKVISADRKSTWVHFFNGDIKHVKPDQTVVYYYSEYKVTQTNFPDGLEVVEFPNQQCEKHYPNGTKEIRFPNKTVKYIYPNGEEESLFPDGLAQRNHPNGDVTLRMPNGIKEFYTSSFKRREYPDGTVKTVYPDGRQETHYASGRIKIKDKNGRITTDAVTS